MTEQQQLVLYRRRQYTVSDLIQELKQYNSYLNKYNAQVEVRDSFLRCRTEFDEKIKAFFQYVFNDRSCWRMGQNLKDKDWAQIEKIAKESQQNCRRLNTARTAVVRNWGEAAGELVNNKSHTTVSKVQWILGRINLADARVLVNKAIFKKIKKTEDQDQQWTLGP